jgi:cholesterol oxidase
MQSLESSLRLKPHGRLNTIAADGTARELPAHREPRGRTRRPRDGRHRADLGRGVPAQRPTTAHMIGGAVIGPDAEHGVVDRYRRAYGYQNLLVTDSSTVSGKVGVNPSLTITAMADEAVVHVPAKASS